MTEKSNDDRRIEYRELKEDVVFIELQASSAVSEPVRISISSSVDRSSKGIQFSVDQALELGVILQISVETLEGARLTLVGEVKWCRENVDEKNYYIGFEFFDSEGTDIDEWVLLFDRATLK